MSAMTGSESITIRKIFLQSFGGKQGVFKIIQITDFDASEAADMGKFILAEINSDMKNSSAFGFEE